MVHHWKCKKKICFSVSFPFFYSFLRKQHLSKLLTWEISQMCLAEFHEIFFSYFQKINAFLFYETFKNDQFDIFLLLIRANLFKHFYFQLFGFQQNNYKESIFVYMKICPYKRIYTMDVAMSQSSGKTDPTSIRHLAYLSLNSKKKIETLARNNVIDDLSQCPKHFPYVQLS